MIILFDKDPIIYNKLLSKLTIKSKANICTIILHPINEKQDGINRKNKTLSMIIINY